jgi:hypothetical protein
MQQREKHKRNETAPVARPMEIRLIPVPIAMAREIIETTPIT